MVAMEKRVGADLVSCNSKLSDVIRINANTASALEDIKPLIINRTSGGSQILLRSRVRGGSSID